jgi:hypothetical protein
VLTSKHYLGFFCYTSHFCLWICCDLVIWGVYENRFGIVANIGWSLVINGAKSHFHKINGAYGVFCSLGWNRLK